MISGARRRAQREREERVILAYETAAFTRAEKLGSLESYLEKTRPQPKRGIAEMIATLRDAEARGIPLKVTKVEGGG